MRRKRAGVWPAIAAAGVAACSGAKIHRFEASPRHVCPGERVELVWDFAGSGTLAVAPAVAGVPQGEVPSTGSAAFAPAAPTRVTLHVTRGFGEASGEVDIEIDRRETLTASMADASASCRDGRLSSTAHIRNVAPDVAVDTLAVADGDARVYDVGHVDPRDQRRVTARVSAAAASDAFRGLPLAGDWTIASPQPDGSCEPASLPSNLILTAYTRCGGGGQHDGAR